MLLSLRCCIDRRAIAALFVRRSQSTTVNFVRSATPSPTFSRRSPPVCRLFASPTIPLTVSVAIIGRSLGFYRSAFAKAKASTSTAADFRQLRRSLDDSQATLTFASVWSTLQPLVHWLLAAVVTAAIVAYVNVRLPLLLGQLVDEIVAVCQTPGRSSLWQMKIKALTIAGYYAAQVR